VKKPALTSPDDTRNRTCQGPAEVLVPRTHQWWTLLALAAEPQDPWDELAFVSEISPESRTVIIDINLLPRNVDLLQGKSHVVMILWDGRGSYRDHYADLVRASRIAANVELRFVGELPPDYDKSLFTCRYLFSQQADRYSKAIFSSRLADASFSRPFAKLALRYRPALISTKAVLQLAAHARLREYHRTRFVYCGHSGLVILQEHALEYGISKDRLPAGLTDPLNRSNILTDWLPALHRKRAHWAVSIVMKALLRFLALQTIVRFRGKEVFLNIFPQPNINAYQAGMLFNNHTFLDFGGSLGDEAIYPRSADLLLLRRKVLRYDFKSVATELRTLSSDSTNPEAFINKFQEWILSQFDSALSGD
jgi:hypothetical protein